MNTEELIKKYEVMQDKNSSDVVAIEIVLQDLQQLNELQKIKIPEFVAVYIEESKGDLSLREAMNQTYASGKVDTWLREYTEDAGFLNQELFAKAWVYGYEIEK